MARLDLRPMPGVGTGYVVNVQAELLTHLATRVVVPLLPETRASTPISELNPMFEIEGTRHVLVTQALAAVSGRELKPAVGLLDAGHDSITRALDLLFVGF
nr:CcdB family protein [uncultured Lichenicoccus sp.]